MSARSIAKSSLTMMSGTLASRILGLIRNALLVAALGATASGAADAFNVANMLPTQLYTLLIAGILNAILVPQIVRALQQRNGEELVNRLLTAAATLIAAVSAVLTIAAPLVVLVYASGLGRWQPLAFAFAFWCMPQIFFYGLYALWGQVLNARGNFGPYMWSPVLNNIISIGAIIAYLQVYGAYAGGEDPSAWNASRIMLIGATSTLGIAVQALILYFPLKKSGFTPRFVWGVRGLGLGKIGQVAGWALLGTLLATMGDLAVTNVGTRAVSAAETAEYANVIVPSTTMYANALMLYMLPQSLITTSIVTALFTRMSEHAAKDDAKGVVDDVSLGIRSVAVFTVLCSAGLMTLAAPALQVIVPSISQAEANASAPVLVLLAAGIVFQGWWFTAQRAMLAYEDTKRLTIADATVGGLTILIAVIGVLLAPANHWMAWAAAGNTIGLIGACVVVFFLLRRHIPDMDWGRVFSTHLRLVVAVIPAVVVGRLMVFAYGPIDGTLTGSRASDATLLIAITAIVMTLIYVLIGRMLRVPELSRILLPLAGLLRKLGRALPGGLGQWVVAFANYLAPRPKPMTGTALQPEVPMASTLAMATPTADRIGLYASLRTGGIMSNTDAAGTAPGTSIGTGRYRLISPRPSSLPRVLTHDAVDTILDKPVTVLSLTDITPQREAILEAAARAVLVSDPRMQRIMDIEQGNPAFIIAEPAAGKTFGQLVEASALSPAQVRAVVGEVAQVLDACSRRDLHHGNLSPASVRLRPDGRVQVTGIGIEAASLGLTNTSRDPLRADRTDALALVELLYFGLTAHWPGKRTGIASAPMRGGVPAAPSTLNSRVGTAETDLEVLIRRTYEQDPPLSAAEVATALGTWEPSSLVGIIPDDEPRLSTSASAGMGAGPVAAGVTGSGTADASAVTTRATTTFAAKWPSLRKRGDAESAAPASSAEATALASNAAQTTPLNPAARASTSAAGEAAMSAPASPSLPTPRTDSFAGTQPQAVEQTQAALSASQAAASTNSATSMPAPAPAPSAPAGSHPPAPVRSSREELEEDEVAANRTAMTVLAVVAALVLIGAFFAIANLLGLSRLSLTNNDIPAARTVPTAQAPATTDQSAGSSSDNNTTQQAGQTAPVMSAATALDPYGDNNEHPELAGNVVDGDPATEWHSRYYAASSLAWKQGMGVSLALQHPAQISGITLQGTGQGGHVQIRATSAEDPQGGTLLAEGSFTSGTTTFSFPATETQNIVVWVTELPRANDGLLKITIGEASLQ